MTTWCRPDIQQQQQQSTVSERRCANKQQQQQHQQQQQRHSIADILGWTATSNSEVKVEGGVVMMASSFQDSDMMQMNDEPLDLSLDKSKCRARERESAAAAAAVAATTGIKRSKTKSVVVQDDLVDGDDDPMMNRVSGHGDREVDEDGEPEMWPSDMMMAGQPNQQQVQVQQLYMMMLAARLMQSNEAVRYQESQGRRGEDGSSDDVGDDGPGSGNDPMAVVTAAAAAAAAAAGLLGHHQLSNSGIDSIGGHPAAKRRKKDHVVVMAGDDPTANGARPRKTRTTFTGKQLFELERIFEQKKYLSSNERQEVARLLNVTGSQIKIWFQNRRTKWKKQDPSTAAELAQLKSASRSSSSQQQQPLPGKANQSGSSSADQMGLAPTDEEAHSDESSPSGPSSPL